MALPKKGLRKITIYDKVYGWSATGNDGWISLSIALLEGNGQLLTAQFDYHHKEISIHTTADGTTITDVQRQLIITPHIVKQVIEYALQQGWTPAEKKPQMNLGDMDDKIKWTHEKID